jgi:AIPR protein
LDGRSPTKFDVSIADRNEYHVSILTLKSVREGRRTTDPVNEHFYQFTGMIPLEEVILLKHGGTCPWTNPRFMSPNSAIAKEIAESAVKDLGKFHKLNRGPVLIADAAKLENGILTIDFGSSAKKRGLADGGTTVTALTQVISEGFEQSREKELQQFVNIRVMCGPYTEPEVEQLVEALNTNKQVDDFSMAEYRNDFSWIKSALASSTPHFPPVIYKVGDEGEYTIQEIVQILSLFALPEPSTAYVSKQKCLDTYLDDRKSFEKYSGVLIDLLKLSEYIPLAISTKYNKDGGKLLALEMIKSKPSRLPFLGKSIGFTPHKAWLFPMLASLKSAMNIPGNGGTVTWKVSPTELVDAVATTLFNRVKKSFEGSLNAVGRNAELYEVLNLLAEKTVDKMVAEGKTYRKSVAA